MVEAVEGGGGEAAGQARTRHLLDRAVLDREGEHRDVRRDLGAVPPERQHLELRRSRDVGRRRVVGVGREPAAKRIFDDDI